MRTLTTVKLIAGLSLIIGCLLSCSKKPEAKTARPKQQAELSKAANITPLFSPAIQAKTHPPLSQQQIPTTATPRDKVREHFTELFGDLRHPIVTPEKLQQAWKEFWPAGFNEKLPSAVEQEVAQGHQLPKEVSLITQLKVPLHTQISNGNVSLAQNVQESEAVMAIYTLCVGALASGGHDVPSLLSARAQQLPPNRGDIVVFQILQETLPMVEHQESMSVDQSTLWVELASAPNPIYRLIALQAFASVSVDRDQRLAFYQQYFSETDPVIQKLLVDKLVELPSNRVPDALTALQLQAKQAGNNDLSSYTNQALVRLQQTGQ